MQGSRRCSVSPTTSAGASSSVPKSSSCGSQDAKGTRRVAGFLNDVTWALASDQVDGQWAMLWSDEQRGIGELMIDQSGASSIIRGHASFHRDYQEVFALWMERFAS